MRTVGFTQNNEIVINYSLFKRLQGIQRERIMGSIFKMMPCPLHQGKTTMMPSPKIPTMRNRQWPRPIQTSLQRLEKGLKNNTKLFMETTCLEFHLNGLHTTTPSPSPTSTISSMASSNVIKNWKVPYMGKAIEAINY